MREILFRAKTVSESEYMDDVEWVEGFYTCFNGDEHRIYTGHSETDCGDHYPDWFTVLPETVGQYTGLTDKNGNKIFEGDILKGEQYPYKDKDGDYNYFAEVLWFDNSPGFGTYTFKNPKSKVRGISTGNCDYLEDFSSEDWEVIGNIHDNPELLKGDTENEER